MDKWERMSQDSTFRQAYEAREKALMDEAAKFAHARNEGKKEGIQQGKIQIINGMHELGTIKVKRPENKIYVRPRFRIHGSTDILEHLNNFMFEELGIKKKKLQTDGKIPKTKILYFQSYKDIESILKYIGASETLKMLYSFDLGFHDAEEFKKIELGK